MSAHPLGSLGFLLGLLLTLSSAAASRAPVGGALVITHPPQTTRTDPQLADTPVEATLASLTSRPLCAIALDGSVQPVLARSFERTASTLVIQLQETAGAPAASRVAAAIERVRSGNHPYRALLGGVRGAPRVRSDSVVELLLDGPAPDLERALCHPALSVGRGAFTSERAGPEHLRAAAGFPAGRPFLSGLRLVEADARTAGRMRELGRSHLTLGAGAEGGARARAALHATFVTLPAGPGREALAAALERAVRRDELARHFAPLPSLPMEALLPPGLRPAPHAKPSSRLPGPAGRVEAVLLFDPATPGHQQVAERLQLKLQDLGVHLRLEARGRVALRAEWARGSPALILHGLLLPPSPALALALMVETASGPAARRELESRWSRLPTPQARDALARELAATLRPRLPLVPLYASSLAIAAAPSVSGLAFDAQGLLVLDGAFLGPDAGALP